MTDWIALGPDANGARACAMQDDTLVSDILAADERAALTGLNAPGDASVLRIGEGVPATLPAAVLPNVGNSLSGFLQETPADVIGAWTRVGIAGFLTGAPHWDGVICEVGPDTTHWLHVSADELISCQSFLTPRLITALGGADAPAQPALDDSLSRPERLAAHLRVAEVSGNVAATTGHLIGAAARAYWLGQQVVIFSDTGLAAGYETALASQGVPTTRQNPDTLRAAGLAAIGAKLGYF